MRSLRIVPCTLAQANGYIVAVHRHHGPLPSAKFALAVVDVDGLVRGVALVGLPKARKLMDGRTLEVNRVATDGCPNACSALYGAARRVARELGYARLVTYVLDEEPGTSLRASGWHFDGIAGGGDWHRSRPTISPRSVHQGPKGRWSIDFGEGVDVVWPSVLSEQTASLFDAP